MWTEVVLGQVFFLRSCIGTLASLCSFGILSLLRYHKTSSFVHCGSGHHLIITFAEAKEKKFLSFLPRTAKAFAGPILLDRYDDEYRTWQKYPSKDSS